jgi:enterobactin synthetase component F
MYLVIHEAISAHASSKTAIADGSELISFTDLNERANRLGNHLLATKILTANAHAPVGVHLSSHQAIVSILAILKTGNAYLPLDPEYPAKRIQQYTRECACAVVLCTHLNQSNLDGFQGQLVKVDDLLRKSDDTGDNMEISVVVDPSAPAYVLFTSGSTGRPKGVVGSHLAAMHRFQWMWKRFPFTGTNIVIAAL